jgi:hypothetical protein
MIDIMKYENTMTRLRSVASPHGITIMDHLDIYQDHYIIKVMSRYNDLSKKIGRSGAEDGPLETIVMDMIKLVIDADKISAPKKINLPDPFPVYTKDTMMSNYKVAADSSVFTSDEEFQIKSLKAKANNTFNQIKDFNLKNIVLAGGCFTSWLHHEKPDDLDMFILNNDPYPIKCLDEMIERFPHNYKVSDEEYLNNANNKGYITKVVLEKYTRIQHIVTKYKTREELISHFDCEHACVSYSPSDDKLFISRSTYDCMKNKVLKSHNGNAIPEWRVSKFIDKRGFKFAIDSV